MQPPPIDAEGHGRIVEEAIAAQRLVLDGIYRDIIAWNGCYTPALTAELERFRRHLKQFAESLPRGGRAGGKPN